jgi:hypothetical protein
MVEHWMMGDAMDLIVSALTAFFALVGIIILFVGAIVATGILFLVRLPVNYFLALWHRIDADSDYMETSWAARTFAWRKHVDHERSFSQYYLGPVIADFSAVINDAAERQWKSVTAGWSGAAEELKGSDSTAEYIFGICSATGVIIGAIGGIAVTVAIALIHVVIAMICLIAAAISAVVLRGIDTGLRYVFKAGTTCPGCAQTVRPYAAYRCRSCNELHRDVRPGRRGIVKRVCVCGSRLPTLVFFDASGQTTVCPRCGVSLPPRFGKAAEIIVPLVGSINAGKTSLAYMLIMAIQELVTANGGTVELVGDTKDEVDRIAEQVAITGSPSATVPKSPKALMLHVKLRLSERYVHLYDVAGELYYQGDSLDGLPFLDKASTLIYVIDPLAAEGVWDRLSAGQQDAFHPIRSDMAEAEAAYELPREHIRRQMGKRRLQRLAFVVTKADVLADARVLDPGAAIRTLVHDENWMNMGNIVREAEHSFGQVKYFTTAAIADESGLADESVTGLATWLLLTDFTGLSLARR